MMKLTSNKTQSQYANSLSRPEKEHLTLNDA